MAGTSLEHTTGETGSHGTDLEHHGAPAQLTYNPDAPSEQWGWHGSWRQFAPRGSRALIWLGIIGCFVMLFGNHVSNVENWWLIAIGLLLIFWLVMGEIRIRKERQRKP